MKQSKNLTKSLPIILTRAYLILELNEFYLRVFMFWFDRESIIAGNLGFAISVCRLRERRRMSKSVYVRVVHDLKLLRYVLRCAIERQL